jgi:hypothetical protein
VGNTIKGSQASENDRQVQADFRRRRDALKQILEKREWGPGITELAQAALMATDPDRSVAQYIRDRINSDTLEDDSLLLEALLKLSYYSDSVRDYPRLAHYFPESKHATDDRAKRAAEFDDSFGRLEQCLA